jgi:hypothetical protein
MLIPIIVAGCERSGTTMLGAMLGELDGVVCLPESPFIGLNAYTAARGPVEASLIRACFERHERFDDWREAGCRELSLPLDEKERYDALVSGFVRQYAAAVAVGAPVWFVEHSPTNVLRLDRLVAAFPAAKVLHIVRDGRAVAASLFEVDWGPNDAKAAALLWSTRVAAGLAAEQRLGPGVVHRVTYEALVTESDEALRSISAFTGIPLQRTQHNAFRVPSYAATTHRLVGARPDPRRIHAWKDRLTARQIEIFEATAGSLLSCLGYVREHGGIEPRPPTLLESGRHLAVGAAKTLWNETRRALRRRTHRVA